MPSSSVTITSKTRVYPDKKSNIKSLKLSVSDIPMLSCQYIQKGVLFSLPSSHSFSHLITSLQLSLSSTLSLFPPLAGRLHTDPLSGHIHILCNDAGVDFLSAQAPNLTLTSLLLPPRNSDVPNSFKEFFAFDNTLSYSGHFLPLAALQVTQLYDGVFIGCTVNHAVTDGTSFWHFFNSFAEMTRNMNAKISNLPVFRRDTVFDSPAVLKFPPGGPAVTFSGDEPLRERIFHFSRESILELKHRANYGLPLRESDVMMANGFRNGKCQVSSFQSLSAQLWRSVTRARKLNESRKTTFRMAVNCRHRLEPRVEPFYFGNAIQSIPTYASVGELLSNDLCWGAEKLHENVVAYGDDTVRKGVEDWEREPRLFPLGNADGASITMGSSPRFPMYNNDFGWGMPLAVRSGKANKFDGKISAFPGRDGDGSVDLEVVLAPDTMAGIESDPEFMQYVSDIVYEI